MSRKLAVHPSEVYVGNLLPGLFWHPAVLTGQLYKGSPKLILTAKGRHSLRQQVWPRRLWGVA